MTDKTYSEADHKRFLAESEAREASIKTLGAKQWYTNRIEAIRYLVAEGVLSPEEVTAPLVRMLHWAEPYLTENEIFQLTSNLNIAKQIDAVFENKT